MNDMLVRLLDLPSTLEKENQLEKENIIFRRPIAPEKSIVINWVRENFSEYWSNEVDIAFSSNPITCFLAQRDNEILGFSCYECTGKNFFGPTGTLESERNNGIGKVLLIKSLEGLKTLGYTYGVVGGVGPAEYYAKAVGAKIIEGSEKSIYQNMLKIKK